jgi:rod shape-determining protein MreD
MQQTKLSHVYLTLFVAYLLLLLPWSEHALKFRPDFTLLVLIYWIIRAPHLCNIGTAWVIGLLVDLATGGIFGQNAWAYTVSAFFTMLYQRRLVLFNNLQLFFYVFLMLITAQVTLLILHTFSGIPFAGWIYFMPSLTGVILWQLAFIFKLHSAGRPSKI